ncbi:MAG: hypothetical protein AAF844_05360 [Pseudomonadota bacterium]
MYANDSFFTLSPMAAFGLAVLSTALAAALLGAVRAVSKTRSVFNPPVVGALALWWVFLWLSPQLYYTYYMAVFPALPVQSVIRWPPGPLTLLELLSLTGPATLAAHAQGALGWACLGLSFRCRYRAAEPFARFAGRSKG